MSFAPDITEQLARARADLRMGVPVVLAGGAQAALVLAAETLTAQRLADVLALGGAPVLAITARRAETLKARAYDGNLARVLLPPGATPAWVQSIADPAADFARLHGLTLIDLTAAAPILARRSALHPVVNARLPMEVSEAGRLHIFRPEDGGEEHYAIEIGRPARNTPVLCRLHSACFTGDLMGSLKCDCGPQLRAALAQMGGEGNGVLLYLNQEGRGIGLANKMRAYSLQDQGFDTVEANHRLGFEDDERDFRLGADILRSMGFSAVRLLTNNPRKVGMMEQSGIAVTQRVPLAVGENRHNSAYLATKAAKSGHLL